MSNRQDDGLDEAKAGDEGKDAPLEAEKENITPANPDHALDRTNVDSEHVNLHAREREKKEDRISQTPEDGLEKQNLTVVLLTIQIREQMWRTGWFRSGGKQSWDQDD